MALPCSPNRSFKFSDLPTISTADTRIENLAPVLKSERHSFVIFMHLFTLFFFLLSFVTNFPYSFITCSKPLQFYVLPKSLESLKVLCREDILKSLCNWRNSCVTCAINTFVCGHLLADITTILRMV